MNLKDYIKERPVATVTESKPLAKRKTQAEIDLINELKVPALSKKDSVILKALRILKLKKKKRIAEMEELDKELDLQELRDRVPQEKVDVLDYFQKLEKLSSEVSNDISAEKQLAKTINHQTIRDLAKKEVMFKEYPDTETAKEFYAFRRAFIKYLGTDPSEEALKKMLTQDLKASKARLKETFFEKALSLVKGKSFTRLMSECKLKTGNEDTLTKITLDEAIKREKQSSLKEIKANRILSFQEFNQ
jgi:hypothetical protein